MSTFNVGDVDVELGELFTRALHALVHRLQDLFRVLLHPPGKAATNQIRRLIRGLMRDPVTHPSFGKLCLISTW